MVSISIPKRADSVTFLALPTGRHILAGRLLGWVNGEGQLGTWGACCLFKWWVLGSSGRCRRKEGEEGGGEVTQFLGHLMSAAVEP